MYTIGEQRKNSKKAANTDERIKSIKYSMIFALLFTVLQL